MKKYFVLLYIILSLTGCQSGCVSPTLKSEQNKIQKKGVSNKEKILRYFETLNSSNEFNLMLGQNIVPDSKSDHLTSYSQTYTGLYETSGKYPSIIGCSIGEFNKHIDWIQEKLFNHWKKGGIVYISWHVENPWTGGEASDKRYANLAQLLDPKSNVYNNWIQKLDETANILKFFAKRDIPVIWRPFHEMNGDWYWYGSSINDIVGKDFKELWREVYRYLTIEKELNNLLWLYAPMDDSQWVKASTIYYPGDEYVDLIGISYYGGDLNIQSYKKLLAFGKHIGIAEFGPINTGEPAKNRNDFSADYLVSTIKQNFPKIIFCYSWHGWLLNNNWIYQDLAHYPGIDKVLNTPGIITCDELIINY